MVGFEKIRIKKNHFAQNMKIMERSDERLLTPSQKGVVPFAHKEGNQQEEEQQEEVKDRSFHLSLSVCLHHVLQQ